MMEALLHLPDKGVFGVPEGWRGIPSSNPTSYVCCHPTAAHHVVKNAKQTLREMYRTAHKRQSAPAAAKRQAKQQLDTNRPSKRHHQAAAALENDAAAVAGNAIASTGAGAGGGAGALQDVLNCIASLDKKRSQHHQLQQQTEASLHGLTPVPQQQHQKQQQHPQKQQQEQTRQAARVATDCTHHEQGNHGSSKGITCGSSRCGSGSGSKRSELFTHEQLKAKTNKELVDLLKARRCPVSGKKDELIRRLIDHQWRLQKATQGAAASRPSGPAAQA